MVLLRTFVGWVKVIFSPEKSFGKFMICTAVEI